jgi:hypothetical protein
MEGPENENWAAEVVTLEIVTSCRLSFVIVTLRVALVEPTDSLPKLRDQGLTRTFAWAADPKHNRTAVTAASF